MRSRALRVTLTLLAVAAIGVAGYFYWTTSRRINGELERAAAFTHTRLAASRAALDLRAAQQSYVAVAQDEAFWFDKVTGSLEALRTTIPALDAATASPEARGALAEAHAALVEFEERDRRVRSYVSSGQKLLASDIIFSDGIDITTRLLAALDRAGTANEVAAQAARARFTREQVKAAAGAAAVAVLAMLLLTPLRPRDGEVSPAAAEVPKVPGAALGLELRPPAAPPASKPVSAKSATVANAPAQRAAAAADKPRQPVIQLEALARVCSDLARLTDSSTIPALLERTATTLDASGLVLWVADVEREELVPIAAHGYSATVLSRMGTLSTQAENATGAAFRTGLLQTVHGDGTSAGAVAAPLVSASGCLGVMSAEMRHEGEKLPARLAAAAIVAAQLATIIGPAGSRSAKYEVGS